MYLEASADKEAYSAKAERKGADMALRFRREMREIRSVRASGF